jgi:predicted transposase YbfD/YdcC
MYSTPLAQVLAALSPLSAAQQRALLHDPALTSLGAAFAGVPDARARRGRRYPLAFLLTCLVAGLLAGCDCTHALGQWCAAHQALLGRLFPAQCSLTPSGSLYRRLLPRLAVEPLEWALAGGVRATRPAEDIEPVAFDGKTVRRARNGDHAAPHLLAVSTHHTQETLLQVRVGSATDKTNAIPIAQALLPLLSLRGRVVTADALHTQVDLVAGVGAQGGDVVLTVKGNQPSPYADLATSFADPATPCIQAQTIDRRRGRVACRQLRVSTEMVADLRQQARWPHVAQVGALTRTVRMGATTTVEVVYLLTTLPPERASPADLLELVRAHWHIENGLHYVRDVTFGEDRSRLRTGHGPQILAALRNLALTLIHRTGSHQIAVSRRPFAAHPERAFALLLPAA